MQELLAQILGYVWGVWRYRWYALVVAWVVCVAGWAWVFQVPAQYQATARIHVDTNTVLRPLLRGLTIQADIDDRIQLMSKTLLSRPNLEKLMRMTDMDIQVKTDAQKDAMIESLRNNIRLAGDQTNPSLYSISFNHQDREVSKQVVQSLITVFIESTLGGERADSVDAQKFLNEQIVEYEKRLTDAESRLAKFKQKNVNLLPGQEGDYFNRLSTAKTQLSAATLELNEATQRRNELKRQVEGEDPVFLSGATDSYQQSPIDTRINNLKSRLDELLTRYTDKYPEVVQLQKLILDLENEKQEEIKKALNGQPAEYAGLQESPVYQQMRTMLAEAEARVAEITVRVKEYQSRTDELERMVDNIPIIEAELKQLNRDYEIVQQKHSELLARRESALISQDVEQKSNDLVFRVIDPPFVPLKPNAPNKAILNSVVLLAGLGLGGGIAFLWSLLYPVIIDRHTLSRAVDLPILGTVTLIPTGTEKKRARINRIYFASTILLLLFSFTGLLIF